MKEGIWEVLMHGDINEDDFELSVIRKGHASWGWGDDTKIILFGSGLGQNDLMEGQEKFALETAKKFCAVLNNET
jgi:hypothetical protein